MHSDMLSREDYNNFLRDRQRPQEDNFNKKLNELVSKVNALQISDFRYQGEDYNKGIVDARDLIKNEIKDIFCPEYRRKEKDKEEMVNRIERQERGE